MKIDKPYFKKGTMESPYLKVLKSLLDCPKDDFDATYFELLCTPLTIKNYSKIETTIKTIEYAELAKTYWKWPNEENGLKLKSIIKDLETKQLT